MTVQDGEGTAFCLSCENAGLRARIAELEAALREILVHPITYMTIAAGALKGAHP
jgi:hypothetical protein